MDKKSLKHHFDDLSSKYDEQSSKAIPYVMEVANDISSMFKEATRILDVGCSTGFHASILTKATSASDVVGVDFSNQMVTIAHRNCGKHGKVSLLTADIESLPFRDESFEGVSCCFVINLLNGFHWALPEVRRVLAKGGKFVIADVETTGEQCKVRRCLFPLRPRIKGIPKLIDFSQMGEILEKFDFSLNNAKKYKLSLRDAKLYVIEASKL